MPRRILGKQQTSVSRSGSGKEDRQVFEHPATVFADFGVVTPGRVVNRYAMLWLPGLRRLNLAEIDVRRKPKGVMNYSDYARLSITICHLKIISYEQACRGKGYCSYKKALMC